MEDLIHYSWLTIRILPFIGVVVFLVYIFLVSQNFQVVYSVGDKILTFNIGAGTKAYFRSNNNNKWQTLKLGETFGKGLIVVKFCWVSSDVRPWPPVLLIPETKVDSVSLVKD